MNVLGYGGSGLFAGGYFTSLGGVARTNLAAVDAATGVATSWNPGADSPVDVMITSHDTLYVGGGFTTVNGQPRGAGAAFKNGSLLAWNPNVTGTLYAMTKADSTIFIGGQFTAVGGTPVTALAQVNAATGALGAALPATNLTVRAFVWDPPVLYLGGDFFQVGGLGRHGAAAIRPADSSVLPWFPLLQPYSGGFPTVHAMARTPGGILLGGDFTINYDNPHSCLAEIDVISGNPTFWPITANATVNAMAQVGTRVFAGGYFYSLLTTISPFLVSLNTYTHAITAFNVGLDQAVNALAIGGNTLEVGGWFLAAGNGPHARIVGITGATTGVEDGALADARVLRLSANPSRGAVWLEFELPSAGPAELDLYDVGGRRVRHVAWERLGAGLQRVAWDGTDDAGRRAPAGLYLARVRAGGVERTAKLTRWR